MENRVSSDGSSGNLLNLRESAAFLGVSSRTVRRLIDQDQLTYHFVGKSIRIRISDLEEYLNWHRFEAR